MDSIATDTWTTYAARGDNRRRPSVAVVGAGISGLTAAYLLFRTHDVILFEAEDRLGGHAHTHDVADSDGRQHAVDSGFIVHNDVTYPWLRKLFGELAVEVRPTEMSMSVRCTGCGLEYAGGRGRAACSPSGAAWSIHGSCTCSGRSSGSTVAPRPSYARPTTRTLRLTASSWSGRDSVTTSSPTMPFPSSPVCGPPVGRRRWSIRPGTCFSSSTTTACCDLPGHLGGTASSAGRGAMSTDSPPCYRTCARPTRSLDITRREDGVEIRDVTGQITRVDRVVIATHADQALALLSDPSDAEVSTLKEFGYSSNVTALHTDGSALPRARAARASWNYTMASCGRTGPARRGDLLDEPPAGAAIAGDFPRHAQRP